MKLVAIERFGTTAEPIGNVPDAGRDVCNSMVDFYEEAYAPPWIGYLAVLNDTAIGTCAFKGPPKDGRVEIAYFTFPGNEGQGTAKAMAQALLDLAQRALPGVTVAAQTMPEESASTSVLRRLGFTREADVQHPEDGLVWEWHHRG